MSATSKEAVKRKVFPKGKQSLADSLFGIFGKYTKGKPKLKKADVNKATKAGFIARSLNP